MTTTPGASNPLVRALKKLATAIKAIAFDPPHHPTVVSTLEQTGPLLKETTTAKELLTVGVCEEPFLLDGSPIDRDDRSLAVFATYLSRRDLSAVMFPARVEPDALKGF